MICISIGALLNLSSTTFLYRGYTSTSFSIGLSPNNPIGMSIITVSTDHAILTVRYRESTWSCPSRSCIVNSLSTKPSGISISVHPGCSMIAWTSTTISVDFGTLYSLPSCDHANIRSPYFPSKFVRVGTSRSPIGTFLRVISRILSLIGPTFRVTLFQALLNIISSI